MENLAKRKRATSDDESDDRGADYTLKKIHVGPNVRTKIHNTCVEALRATKTNMEESLGAAQSSFHLARELTDG